MDWQPIETAPKDGTEILLCGPAFDDPTAGTYMAVGGYFRGAWREDADENDLHSPTHWMPLPPPPPTV